MTEFVIIGDKNRDAACFAEVIGENAGMLRVIELEVFNLVQGRMQTIKPGPERSVLKFSQKLLRRASYELFDQIVALEAARDRALEDVLDRYHQQLSDLMLQHVWR